MISKKTNVCMCLCYRIHTYLDLILHEMAMLTTFINTWIVHSIIPKAVVPMTSGLVVLLDGLRYVRLRWHSSLSPLGEGYQKCKPGVQP